MFILNRKGTRGRSASSGSFFPLKSPNSPPPSPPNILDWAAGCCFGSDDDDKARAARASSVTCVDKY
jgi:hypothetical protein